MAAGKATPPLKSYIISNGTIPIFSQSQNPLSSKPLELSVSYSTIVQNPRFRQPSSSPLTETKTQHNVWIEEAPELLKPFSIVQGKPSFDFSTSETNDLVQKVNYVLIGKFSHGRPPMASIKEFFAGLKLQGDYNICSFDSKHIYIECMVKKDFYRIWLNLAWIIKGYTMKVFKWTCDFTPDRESSLAPVWIRLENLPLYLFDKMSLSSLSSSIGKPICVDPRNINRSLLNCALICVELDVSKPLVESIRIGFIDEVTGASVKELLVKVSYDVVPHFCSLCCHLGHSSERCKSKLNSVMDEAKVTQSKKVEMQWEKAPLIQIKSNAMRLCPAECSVVKSVVPSAVTNCKPLHSKSWQPVGKKLTSSAKDVISEQNRPIVINNRFTLLDKQPIVPSSTPGLLNTVLAPAVAAALPVSRNSQEAIAAQNNNCSITHQPATAQDAAPVLADEVCFEIGSAAEEKAAIFQLAASGSEQKQVETNRQQPALFEDKEKATGINVPVLVDKTAQIGYKVSAVSQVHCVDSTESAAEISPLLLDRVDEAGILESKTRTGLAIVEGSAAHSSTEGIKGASALVSNKVEMAAAASSSYAAQLSDTPVVTSQAFSLHEATFLRTQNQSEQPERAAHEITKKQVQEPDFRSDQVGHQKRSNEQAVVDLTKMSTSQIRSYTDQQCKEMIKEMNYDPGLLFSSSSHLTLAQLKSDFANRYLDSDNAYDCLGLSGADDSQYEEMDEDKVLPYEEELANHFCDELDKKQKKKNRLFASPPTFRVGMLR